MGRHLLIAGHGRRRNGSFDPGATGHISKGEHRYVKEDLFPAMRKFVPKDYDIVFFDKYNVYDHGNIVDLADQYDADEVTEVHFDAASAAASGGHVIIYDGYAPDKMDLALRDAIDDMVGVRYSHRGHKGVDGRSNLANVNRTANANVTYRLIELGFGTNEGDARVLTEDVEEYAKKLVKAITGTSNDAKPSRKSSGSSSKSISQMADEVEAGKHGTGHDNRRKSLGISQSDYEKVRAEVNRRAGVSSSSTGSSKSISQMADEVEAGQHGTGHVNRRQSLGISQSRYEQVRAEVNKRAGGSSGRSISQMADMIINDSSAPTGHDARQKWLGIDNTTYQKVRAEVNSRF